MLPLLNILTSAPEWRKKRREYFIAARACRDALTNPEGYWRYDIQDERVKDAVGKWVARARKAHDFSLGRKPVIENFVMMNSQSVYQGNLYVK